MPFVLIDTKYDRFYVYFQKRLTDILTEKPQIDNYLLVFFTHLKAVIKRWELSREKLKKKSRCF